MTEDVDEEPDLEPEPGPGRRWFAGWVGVGVALGALLTAAGWWLVRPAPAPATASAATSTVGCTWKPPTVPSGPNGPALRDVGTPPEAGNPRGGTATMRLETTMGVITIAMDRQGSPCTVASFHYLAGRHFFDGSHCHRLTTTGIFVLQCGDPSATGTGGPTYEYDDENLPPSGVYRRGTVAMANAGPGTNSSQFFIAYRDSPIQPAYTVFGVVVSGLDIIDRVAAGGVPPYRHGDGEPLVPLVLSSFTVSP
jgi:peptidyl-prolyl cis-trans isomerase B (cyclophilin B)